MATVPTDIQGARLAAVLKAPRLESAFDVAGVEPVAVNGATGRGVGHERDEARAVRSGGRTSTRDVRRTGQLLHERQQRCRCDSKHGVGLYQNRDYTFKICELLHNTGMQWRTSLCALFEHHC